MWNKIKWVSIGVIIGCLLYLNYQTDNRLRDRIQQLEVDVSHHRTDIIGLKGDIDAFGITMTFHRNEIDLSNYSNGVYFIKLFSHKGSELKRVLLSR